MRRSSFAFLALIGLAITAGCSVSTTPNSFTLKTQTKFVGSNAVSKTATTDWASGSTITIDNGNGDVVVQGTPGLTKITVSTKIFAFADVEADGDAAIADVTGTVAIDESSGNFNIHCSTAKSSHASAATGTTGCEGFTVQVPAGAAATPVTVTAAAHNGTISATGLVGSATIHADNGDATASLTPVAGSTLAVSSGNGDVALSLPSDFTTDAITLTGSPVVNTAFPDVNETTIAHRKSGGAKSITVSTELGKVSLLQQ